MNNNVLFNFVIFILTFLNYIVILNFMFKSKNIFMVLNKLTNSIYFYLIFFIYQYYWISLNLWFFISHFKIVFFLSIIIIIFAFINIFHIHIFCKIDIFILFH